MLKNIIFIPCKAPPSCKSYIRVM